MHEIEGRKSACHGVDCDCPGALKDDLATALAQVETITGAIHEEAHDGQ